MIFMFTLHNALDILRNSAKMNFVVLLSKEFI
jgi:hypothetical protein